MKNEGAGKFKTHQHLYKFAATEIKLSFLNRGLKPSYSP
ncbi:hypothetical protein HMPREF1324_2148 [Rothia aeria F0474]|uniref:Uncharacterized protein n=1 Tax=Rothia aeria F0474 TaxID=1125724 RepID=I0UU25_9MICC|nr:hypothetical protein HMPREF1324_2148 [Rothia aeria F0474]